jgi:hypothetical protein
MLPVLGGEVEERQQYVSRWAKQSKNSPTSSPVRPRLAARDRLPATPHVSARSVVAALALLAGPGLTACSSPPPAPPRQPVGVETSVSTRYYPVRRTTTTAIFAAIDANGLVDALNWACW